MSIVPYAPRASSLDLLERGGELAERIANTDFVPKGLRGNPAAILAAILYGHEVGLGPMQSLSKIAVIEGRPTLSAEAMRGLILAAGHELWIEDQGNTRVTLAGRRRDGENTSRVTWTLDDAKRARIAGKSNWQAYPRQMLLARATAELARAIFADVIGGLAVAEELDAETIVGEAVETPVAESEPKTRRRRRVATAPEAVPAPETPPEQEPEPSVRVPEPDATPDPMSAAQRAHVFALFHDLGIDEANAQRRYVSSVVGREVTSRASLSALEASRVIESLLAHQGRRNEREVQETLEEIGAREVTPDDPDPFPPGF